MRILVTNDDGIESLGLRRLVDWAGKLGDVIVVAPREQQSCKSHSINLASPFSVCRTEYPGCSEAYIVDSTPADCIRIAVCFLHLPFDFLLSGVNSGLNVGIDVLYSGTCAAVIEAGTYNYKGVAVSTDHGNMNFDDRYLDRIFDYFKDNRLFSQHQLFNVNLPDNPSGIAFTKLGDAYLRDRFVRTEGNLVRAEGYIANTVQDTLDDDLNAVLNHFISISPLTTRLTDTDAYLRIGAQLKQMTETW